MIDIKKELKRLEDALNEYNLDVRKQDAFTLPIHLTYYELDGYRSIIKKLNNERNQSKTFEEKIKFLSFYKLVYQSEQRMIRRLLKNIKEEKLTIQYTLDGISSESLNKYYIETENINDENLSLDQLLNKLFEKGLKRRSYILNRDLYILKSFPFDLTNTFSTFIGPDSMVKHRDEMIIYKDVFIAMSESGSNSIYYNERSLQESKNALLNIAAFLSGQPFYFFTENYNFNRKLYDLYSQFDLLDMLRLRKKDFFLSKEEDAFHLSLPILKRKNKYPIVQFKELEHEMILELYHASLKQFESLPRCVFLYRVVEYGIKHHYQPLKRPSKLKPADALNYYAQEILTHKYMPLYYADLGSYFDVKEKKINHIRKPRYVNFTAKLKIEATKIKREWNEHNYLKNKSLGDIIYGTGRNAAAHGGGGRSNARYDYSTNYKHINSVNIFLELIARYVIEELNPSLKNMVETKTKLYKYQDRIGVFNEEKNF